MNYSVSTDALKEKVILVTGAGDGIGKQAAICFAAHGATVILLGRTVKSSYKPMMLLKQRVIRQGRLFL